MDVPQDTDDYPLYYSGQPAADVPFYAGLYDPSRLYGLINFDDDNLDKFSASASASASKLKRSSSSSSPRASRIFMPHLFLSSFYAPSSSSDSSALKADANPSEENPKSDFLLGPGPESNVLNKNNKLFVPSFRSAASSASNSMLSNSLRRNANALQSDPESMSSQSMSSHEPFSSSLLHSPLHPVRLSSYTGNYNKKASDLDDNNGDNVFLHFG